MIVITFCLLAGCIVFLAFINTPMRLMREELSLLPHGGNKGGFRHPILGVQLPLLLPVPDEVAGKSAIVVMADPSCRSCDGEMQELAWNRRVETIPAVCYYEHEGIDPAVVHAFVSRYARDVPMIPMSRDLVSKLSINGSPFIFLIDADGIVVRVQSPLKRLVEYFRHANGSQQQ